jgi:hypothetical protein
MAGEGCEECGGKHGPTGCGSPRYLCLGSVLRGGGGCEKCDANPEDDVHCEGERGEEPWNVEPLPCPRRIFGQPT